MAIELLPLLARLGAGMPDDGIRSVNTAVSGVDKLEEGAHVRVQIEGEGGRGGRGGGRRGDVGAQPAGGDTTPPAGDSGGATTGGPPGANPAAGARPGRGGSQK